MKLASYAEGALTGAPGFPTLPSEADRRIWVGLPPDQMRAQSIAFMETLEAISEEMRGQPLEGARFLDFGCGWGRLTRLLAFYSPPENIWGVDPWDQSINACMAHKVPGRFRMSARVPGVIPIGEPVDVTIAFSVFTHLSEVAARAAMAAIRKQTAPGGIFVFTIRPRHVWAHLKEPHHEAPEFARGRDVEIAGAADGNVAAAAKPVKPISASHVRSSLVENFNLPIFDVHRFA